MKIALIHYSYTPIIGGVEFVVEQHAGLFLRRGNEVRVVCGMGACDRRDLDFVLLPELSVGHPLVEAAQEEIETSEMVSAGGAFQSLVALLVERLIPIFSDRDVVFVHNMLTMHFNLAATAALREVAVRLPQVRFIGWIHDMSATNSDYVMAGAQWVHEMLSTAPPQVEMVAISERRREEFCKLTGCHHDACTVVPNGVEHLRLLELTAPVRGLVREMGILYRDIVFLQPARILKRKNIELGVRVVAALKALGARCLYLVTGAPDPHHAAAAAYGEEIRTLVSALGVEEEFLFIRERFSVTDEDLTGLYQVADALFLPSRQEGFGLPLLEASIFRLPIFCAQIEPMQSLVKHNVTFFSLEENPEEIALQVLGVLGRSEGFFSRKEVMRKYAWDTLYEEKIAPLFLVE